MGIDVLVVGSVNEDIVVSVERLPGPGETLLASEFALSCGGKGPIRPSPRPATGLGSHWSVPSAMTTQEAARVRLLTERAWTPGGCGG